ncbi:NAD+ synthase [Desulfovirgula thermocuniculi]|uniref:NAD+ synthase n=1 Tax=Desulfovirgula thermocuniculi TaxID=348842 RepID=UPI00047F34E9|nr:NAD+ synthase [Desulfovirgula thermocuniculi]
MRIALAQLNPTVGHIGGNVDKIKKATACARQVGAELVIFPEMAVTGYPPRDLLCREDFLRRVAEALRKEVAPLSREIAVLVGAPVKGEGGFLFNAALLYSGGMLLARQDKSLLPNYDVFEESRYFRPSAKREPVVLGDLALGLTVCEDIWNDKDYWNRRLYDLDPVEELVAKGVQLVVNISASPYHYGKIALRVDMIRSMAQKYRRPFIYINQVGGNDELIFDGSSLAVDHEGRVACLAASFEEELVLLEVEKAGDAPVRLSAAGKVTADRLWSEDSALRLAPCQAMLPGILPREDISHVYRALVLGIRDYFRKTGFTKAVVGLSGGIDSSVTAALAAAALGPENVLGVSMPSRYSSPGSRTDARALAANLGISFREIPIEGIFRAYLETMNGDDRPLGDLAEENVQARIRGNILMFISNREGYLVLTTGNKSEMAVGYCTLYGDMCGGLAVLADVPKVMVYELARYINREREIIPHSVLLKAPSAELRPNQVDQDSLPPYEVLDAILKHYVEGGKSWEEIAGNGFDAELVRQVVSMVDRAEYKRRQAPPGLRVTSKAFGMGRRMPIAWREG